MEPSADISDLGWSWRFRAWRRPGALLIGATGSPSTWPYPQSSFEPYDILKSAAFRILLRIASSSRASERVAARCWWWDWVYSPERTPSQDCSCGPDWSGTPETLFEPYSRSRKSRKQIPLAAAASSWKPGYILFWNLQPLRNSS